MIKVQKLEIHEFRGIRSLSVDLGQKNFAVCGPNGTGKSGIVDAVDFGLTGSISRLSGQGTGDLSVKEHGPHVDSRNRPDKARVRLEVYIPSLKIDAVIERTIQDANKPKITPNTPEVKAIFAQVQAHPEFALSRREIIRYILSEPGKRSKEVQALLRLEQVETLRASLQKIANACEKELAPLNRTKTQSQEALCRALGLSQLSPVGLLEAANSKRALLGLPPIAELVATTSIKDGVATAAAANQPQRVVKAQAASDLAALATLLAGSCSDEFKGTRKVALQAVEALNDNPAIADGVAREALLQDALVLFDEKSCPVCATIWGPGEFRAVIAAKLKVLEAASAQRVAAEKLLAPIAEVVASLRESLVSAIRCGKQLSPPIPIGTLEEYSNLLAQHEKQIDALLPLGASIAVLKALCSVPDEVTATVTTLQGAVNGLPEPSVQDAAREFLSIGQEKLEAYRNALLELKAGNERAALSKSILDTYAVVSTAELEAIYKAVQQQFSEFYRFINKDDESKFEARLTPSMARLAFDVDFYGRGFFPPGAYHSEGHQDGMGLCLYLALMKHILGDDFCFAVLDDVVMSVDTGHRREVCKLLKEKFPNTQFILTTHDEIWLRHMQTAGLVGAKAYIQFRRWDVSQGPIEWTDKDIWEEMNAYLKSNDVRSAAALLRHYLEYFSREVCDQTGARVEFRSDGRYELGALFPSAAGRFRDLLKKGKNAAQTWGDDARVAELAAWEVKFAKALADTSAETWQVNPAIHYNEWANFGKADFDPVVEAYKSLVSEFRCASCGGTHYLTFDGLTPNALRCGCGKTNVNLKAKPAAKA